MNQILEYLRYAKLLTISTILERCKSDHPVLQYSGNMLKEHLPHIDLLRDEILKINDLNIYRRLSAISEVANVLKTELAKCSLYIIEFNDYETWKAEIRKLKINIILNDD